jgi:hypothetical protein
MHHLHATTPYQISENDKADRPPHQADDHQGDRSRFAKIVNRAAMVMAENSDVNVSYIHI